MPLARFPGAPLSAFVSVLWYVDGWKPPHARERRLPDGSVDLVITLQHDRIRLAKRGSLHDTATFDAATVTGPHSQSFVIDTSEPDTLIGAHFTPGGAAALMDMPVSETRNAHVPLLDVCGRVAKPLREELLETSAGEARLDVLEHWLLQHLLRRHERDPAVTWAVRQFQRCPQVRVTDVTSRIGRSSRWFIERFATEVGLTPKVFSRVQRFQSVLRRVNGAPVGLADLAASCGYFDQAHFAHDFREFAGITPSTYLADRTEFQNHVAISE